MNENERRFADPGLIEIRKADAKSDRVEGYAAVFNSTTNLGAFDERIAPGAFDDVLNDDVRVLFNHDFNYPLARSNNGQGTAKLWIDDKGLKYSFKPGSQSYARDLVEAIERGDVTQSSFGFQIDNDSQKWEHRDGRDIRTILKVKRLWDVSPVTVPAYTDTAVALRSKNNINKKETSKNENDVSTVSVARQRLQLLKNKK